MAPCARGRSLGTKPAAVQVHRVTAGPFSMLRAIQFNSGLRLEARQRQLQGERVVVLCGLLAVARRGRAAG